MTERKNAQLNEDDFLVKVEEERNKVPRPNILICGYTGSGKTSLIQAILGEEIVDSGRIGVGSPKTQGVRPI